MPHQEEHPSPDVRQALTKLTDALCTWERSTGRVSVLILREVDGFVFRAVNGKPNVPDDVDDPTLLGLVSINRGREILKSVKGIAGPSFEEGV